MFALVSNRNTLYNVMGVKTHLSVNLPQSVNVSGAEINLTLRAVTTYRYVLCCNLAPNVGIEDVQIFKHCHEMTAFFLWIGTYGVMCDSANK